MTQQQIREAVYATYPLPFRKELTVILLAFAVGSIVLMATACGAFL